MGTYAIREEMNGIVEAPGKTWFWELAAAVIDADRCIQCGTCVAACPSDSIGVGENGLPKLVKMCTGCSLCWDFCPRGGLRYEATWGMANGSHSSPTSDWKMTGAAPPANGSGDGVRVRCAAKVRQEIARAQDGGVVTAMLVTLLESGAIHGALIARESPTEPWKAEPFLATTPDDVRACAGSFYNQTMALGSLDLRGADLPPDPRIALVGTPCEVEGLRAMQARPWNWGKSRPESVVLTVALLCTKSFNYEKLMLDEIRDKRGIDLADVGKVDVNRGKLIVEDRGGDTIFEEPIRDFHGAALKGCDECADFLGHAADISVGSVGSGPGWSSVLIRSQAGLDAFAATEPVLDVQELDRPEGLDKLDALDKRIAFASLARPFDPDAPLFIDYEEHLQHYEGSDRAPAGLR